VVVLLLLNNNFAVRAQAFTNGQGASVVIGQSSFTTNTAADGASGLFVAVAGAFDASGNLWVADSFNSRILEFMPPFSNGMGASLVIGQPNFDTDNETTSQSGLDTPTSVAFDASGNLWVADSYNARVVEFKSPFSSGMGALLVLGQNNFTTNQPQEGNFTGSGFANPTSVVFDPSGDLWVLDADANRVLGFKPPFSNGMSASLVIGQPNFTRGDPSTTENGLSAEFGGLAIDSSGNVWVADSGNNRVLEFKAPLSNGTSASVVIGQPNFRTSSLAPQPTQWSLNEPGAVAFDPSGNLWVGDCQNNRVLEFKPPFSTTTTTRMNASLVIGQRNFTTGDVGTTQAAFGSTENTEDVIPCAAPTVDRSGNVWVFDSGNNRVLGFSVSPGSIPVTNVARPATITATATTTATGNQGLAQFPQNVIVGAIVILGLALVALFIQGKRKIPRRKK
jgi:sugar lactone lactonase YvrE